MLLISEMVCRLLSFFHFSFLYLSAEFRQTVRVIGQGERGGGHNLDP